MRILVVGCGAREHALCWRLSQDPGVGAHRLRARQRRARPHFDTAAVDPADPDAMLALAAREQHRPHRRRPRSAARTRRRRSRSRRAADRSSVRPAAPRSSRRARRSRKTFMARHGVPTARSRVCASAEEALDAIRRGELGDRVVVKADGLAAGKGVVVAEDAVEAETAVRAAMVDRAFGDAGERVVLEERLHGPGALVLRHRRRRATPCRSWPRRITSASSTTTAGRIPAGWARLRRRRCVDASVARRDPRRPIVRPVLNGMIAEGTPYSRVPLLRADADTATVRRSSSSTCASAIPRRRSCSR